MARIVYSAQALADLERVIDFLAVQSADAAFEAIAQIRTAVDILGQHPRIGRRVQGSMRELIISHGAAGYIALYRFEQSLQLVRILRVRHQREAGYRD